MSTRILPALVLVALGVSEPANGQGPGPALLGVTGGVVAGSVVSTAIVVADARRGNYLWRFSEVLSWQLTPVVVGAVAGLALGVEDEDRLSDAGVGSAIGLALGAATGAVVGASVWDPPEGAWAGAVIGAGAGVLVGALIGALAHDADDAQPARSRGMPIGVRLVF